MSVEVERRRLERAFHAILLTVAAPSFTAACAASPTVARDGGVDAARGVVEAGLDGCTANEYEVDAHRAPDAPDTCGFLFSCGLTGTGLIHQGCTVLLANDGAPTPVAGEVCALAEGAGCEHDAFAPGKGGALTVLCTPCPGGVGRRPSGLLRAAAARGGAMAMALSRMAFEEGAAVLAFERMEGELAALGAPHDLQRASRRAAADERRHARIMTRLAQRHGGSVDTPCTRRGKRRSLAAMARENAVEGCVRETYGALLARWQATHARDPEMRETLIVIAADEARHAALSWALAAWLGPQLSHLQQQRVTRARARAVEQLYSAVAVDPPPELARRLGLPNARVARSLVAGLAPLSTLSSLARARSPSSAAPSLAARSRCRASASPLPAPRPAPRG